MLLKFIAHGFLTTLIFDILITYILLPLFGLLLLLLLGKESKNTKIKKMTSIFFYPAISIIFLLQVYILSGWAAYMSIRSYIYAQMPTVEHDWLYYLLGFIFCALPLIHTSLTERKGAIGTYVLSAIALIAYAIFSIWPNLITIPYNWILSPLIQFLWN